MKRRRTLHPAVDSLESRLVLSQVAHLPLTADVSDAGMVATAATTSRAVSGKLTGTAAHLPSVPDLGRKIALSGSGHLRSLGMVQVKGTIGTAGFIQSGKSTGALTITNSKGTIELSLTGPTQPGFSSLPTSYSFVITGGTGAYKSISGHGTLAATWKPSASAPQHFRFTLTSG